MTGPIDMLLKRVTLTPAASGARGWLLVCALGNKAAAGRGGAKRRIDNLVHFRARATRGLRRPSLDARSWNEHRLLFLGRGVSETNSDPVGGDRHSGTNRGRPYSIEGFCHLILVLILADTLTLWWRS